MQRSIWEQQVRLSVILLVAGHCALSLKLPFGPYSAMPTSDKYYLYFYVTSHSSKFT
jgi:hypothetical protein